MPGRSAVHERQLSIGPTKPRCPFHQTVLMCVRVSMWPLYTVRLTKQQATLTCAPGPIVRPLHGEIGLSSCTLTPNALLPVVARVLEPRSACRSASTTSCPAYSFLIRTSPRSSLLPMSAAVVRETLGSSKVAAVRGVVQPIDLFPLDLGPRGTSQR
jgi:hypothetical protein